jgi:hypothetical protein
VTLFTVLVAAGFAQAQLLTPLDGPAASLDREVVSAAGRHEAILTVNRFGRYAITVKSTEGVALQLIDRMAGPGSQLGTPGEEDGRLDVFLDRGQYKIITNGHDRAQGEARLEVHPFRELAPEPAEQLIELKPVDHVLNDFEQRSFWLHLKERRWVHIEAAGRALRDLRFWQDGSWLIDGEPSIEVLNPEVGKPLVACRLSIELDAGLHLLTAYGGTPEPWAEETGEFPLHLRIGFPKLPMANRARFEAGPFGIDRWLVPAKANYFRIELPEALPALMHVAYFSDGSAYSLLGSSAQIDKKSREPATAIDHHSSDTGFKLVTIEAAPGQPYVLQHFESARSYSFSGSGKYWISTTHSGFPEDSVDATAFLAHWRYSGGLQKTPLRHQTIPLGATKGWATRCNLLGTMTVYLEVRQTGTYLIESQGTEARFRIEPFFVYRPSEYEAPPFKQGNSEWELDAGYYVLTAEPVQKGILELTVSPRGAVQQVLEELGRPAVNGEKSVRASAAFPSVQLYDRDHYTLFTNQQPGVRAGLVLRRLPLDLREALPITLRAQEKVSIATDTIEESTLSATAEDGTRLDVSVDGGPWQKTLLVARGMHDVSVRNQTEATVVCSLAEHPTRLQSVTPLPQLPVAALAALPDFPVVTQHTPQLFDLGHNSSKTFLLDADQAGLFRLETTGLLATNGTVRSRTITSLASSSAGGTGRNFFLHQYLLSGDYQVTVRTRGRSAGHLGLQLLRTDPLDGGQLEPSLPARASLSAGESIVYQFTVDEPGDFRLRSFALGRTVRCRLEDGNGWPIIKPNVNADIRRHFEAGNYRLVLLPEPVEGRRLTVLERIEENASQTGHGPHPLVLGEATGHRWLEPEGDASRLPDVWTFSLSGATEVAVALTNGMQGQLVAEDGSRSPIEIPVGRGWTGELDAGRYRIEATCSRLNNRVDYTVSVNPAALVAGVERELQLPARIEVAAAGDELVEISSFGVVDCRARLEDQSGHVVLVGDDRPGDWNFHLAGRLEPGRYNLVVQSVDGKAVQTRVRLQTREQRLHEPATLPWFSEFEPGPDEHIVPLQGLNGELLLASIEASEAMGLAVERIADSGKWETQTSRIGKQIIIATPVNSAVSRLRIWSPDRRGGLVHVRAVFVTPEKIGERQLRRVFRLSAIPGFDPPTGAAIVRLRRPGTLQLAGNHDEVFWSADPDRALEHVRDGLLSSTTETGWLVVPLPDRRTSIRAERVTLGNKPLQVSASAGVPVVVDVGEASQLPQVVVAESMLGRPAVRLESRKSNTGLQMTASAARPGFAATVSLDSKASVATTWLASSEIPSTDLRLRRVNCTSTTAETLGYGTHNGSISANQALELELPRGDKELRITLSSQILAAAVSRSAVKSVHHGDRGSWVESFETDADKLLVIGLADGSWAVEIRADDAARDSISSGRSFEKRVARAEWLRVNVESDPSTTRWLSVTGAAEEISFLGNDGLVRYAELMEIGSTSGTLLVKTESGLVMAWVGEDDDRFEPLWQEQTNVDERAVELPARVEVASNNLSLRTENRELGLFQLVSGGPGLFRISTSEGQHHWLLTSPGERLLLARAGSLSIEARALANGRFDFPLHLAIAPVTTIGEGLGPEHFLGPGDGLAFRFSLNADQKVGLGVRANPDTVSCELVNAAGRKIGEGVVQMHELVTGEYYLLVRAPTDGAGVVIRPAVVGLERPSTGPPEDIIRGYVRSEGSAS